MISDILSQTVADIDRYLNDPDIDCIYSGETREQLIRLRDQADDLRSALDMPPGRAPATDASPQQTGSAPSMVDRMMSTETAFEIATAYFSRSDLLKRGWTKGLINKLLGRRDWEFPNPHCPGAAPMSCWEETRVRQAENNEAFRRFGRKIRDDGVPVPE
jgi:hypothetical protein